VPARRKHPIVAKKKIFSNRQRHPTTISITISAPRNVEFAKIPGFRHNDVIRNQDPIKPNGIRKYRK